MWFVPVTDAATTSGEGSGVVFAGVAVPGCSDGAGEAGSMGSANELVPGSVVAGELVLGSAEGDELVLGTLARDPYGSAVVGGGSIAQALRSAVALSTNASRRPIAISPPSHSCGVNYWRRAADLGGPLA